MAKPIKGTEEKATSLSRLAEQSQLDFELGFFNGVIARNPEFIDALLAHGNNLTLKGQYAEGLEIDKRLVNLRPSDCRAHYNLACSFALNNQTEPSLKMLRKAFELGYRDFRYVREDRDLDAIRSDPRFRLLLREFESR